MGDRTHDTGLLLLAVAHDNGLLKGVIVIFQDDFCRMSLDNDNLLGDHSHVRNNERDLFSRRLQLEITVKIGDSGNRRLSFHDDSGPDQRLTSGVYDRSANGVLRQSRHNRREKHGHDQRKALKKSVYLSHFLIIRLELDFTFAKIFNTFLTAYMIL